MSARREEVADCRLSHDVKAFITNANDGARLPVYGLQEAPFEEDSY